MDTLDLPEGKVYKNSVKESNLIMYTDDLTSKEAKDLISQWGCHKIIFVSSDGKYTKTFSVNSAGIIKCNSWAKRTGA